MNHKILLSALSAVALGFVTSAKADLVLENFSSFTSPQTLFYGDWSNTGDPFVGSTAAISTFSQGAGVYNIASASDADSAYVEHGFVTAQNASAFSTISVTLKLLNDNTADGLSVFLIDGNARTAFATFQTNGFSTSAFTTQSIGFTADAGFAANDVTAFRISGNDPFASGTLSVSLDNLSLGGGSTISAVPEPSTYGLAGALALLVALPLRRRPQAKKAA